MIGCSGPDGHWIGVSGGAAGRIPGERVARCWVLTWLGLFLLTGVAAGAALGPAGASDSNSASLVPAPASIADVEVGINGRDLCSPQMGAGSDRPAPLLLDDGHPAPDLMILCPPECEEDADCDDGVFCNGAEVCHDDECEDGPDPCPFDQVCDEDADACISCEEAGCSDCGVTDDGRFLICLVSIEYDAGSDTTTYTYSVCQYFGWDLSHWILGISPECSDEVQSQPPLGVVGVKWETDDGVPDCDDGKDGCPPGPTGLFELIVPDRRELTTCVSAVTKAGWSVGLACVPGPMCEGECQEDEDCEDGDLCTNNTCVNDECVSTPVECGPLQTCDPEDGVCKCGECPFDMNENGGVDSGDYAVFLDCFGTFVGAADLCYCSDVNENGGIDTGDYASFLECFGEYCPCPTGN